MAYTLKVMKIIMIMNKATGRKRLIANTIASAFIDEPEISLIDKLKRKQNITQSTIIIIDILYAQALCIASY